MPMFKKRFKKGEKLPRKGSSFMFYIFKKGLWQNKKKRYREVHEINTVAIIQALYKNNRN
jgi:hypothetical protein